MGEEEESSTEGYSFKEEEEEEDNKKEHQEDFGLAYLISREKSLLGKYISVKEIIAYILRLFNPNSSSPTVYRLNNSRNYK